MFLKQKGEMEQQREQACVLGIAQTCAGGQGQELSKPNTGSITLLFSLPKKQLDSSYLRTPLTSSLLGKDQTWNVSSKGGRYIKEGWGGEEETQGLTMRSAHPSPVAPYCAPLFPLSPRLPSAFSGDPGSLVPSPQFSS